jgi:hypothetical protein
MCAKRVIRSHDETSLVILKWVSPSIRHLVKLSLCEVASEGDEEVWCREMSCFECTIKPSSHAQIPDFSVIGKIQEWIGGVGGNTYIIEGV